MLSADLVAKFLWGSLLLLPLSAVILFFYRKEVELFSKAYWEFLSERWKLVTFLLSGGFITGAGPFTSDPTWDHVNGGLMSLFTFLTSPWSLGAAYKIFQKKRPKILFIPVLTAWLLSVVWSYDIYLFIRDGFFPEASLENFYLSGLLYLSAGLFWNLEEDQKGKISLSFLHSDWPKKRHSRFKKLFWIALPLMLLAIYLTLPLLLEGQL